MVVCTIGETTTCVGNGMLDVLIMAPGVLLAAIVIAELYRRWPRGDQ